MNLRWKKKSLGRPVSQPPPKSTGILCLGFVPPGHYYEYSGSAQLGEGVLDGFTKAGFVVAFYWYAQCNYEGSGVLLGLIDDKWYVSDLSHCSCYGPLDYLDTHEPAGDSLTDIKSRCSEKYYENIEPLIDLAKQHGYK